MKTKSMNNYVLTKQLLISIVLCVYSLSTVGQSISGNVNSEFSERNLGYASVDVFKNGKLVANVLTDLEGNFNVKLDTGLYQCEINYAGFKKITKEIKVSKDEKADFSMPSDVGSKYSSALTETFAAAKVEDYGALYGKLKNSTSIATTNAWGESKADSNATTAKLTAGEINDFSKWELWSDLTQGELMMNMKIWKISPTNRYAVQLTDQNGLPLANAKVELLNGANVIFTSISDNTGKAELWCSLEYDTLPKIFATSINVDYYGEKQTINDVKPFDIGINILKINADCNQSQNVDIAIVVDATGSMGDEIEYLKFDINDVIYKSKEFSNTLNFRFANIFYRDLGDEYLVQSQNFTRTLSESVAFTNNHSAGGGGDGPEAVEIALDSAINKLSWSTDARARILFLVLDAPPHNTPEIQSRMRKICYDAAAKGIRIVPVTGSGTDKNAEYLMRCLALATNGTYTFLTDHSGTGGSHIKPSTDSYQIEILNDLLVRIIKSYTYMPDCQQFIADIGVNLPDSQVVINNYIDSIIVDSTEATSDEALSATASFDLQWKFYPNPTNGIINIVANKEIKELYISDLSGKVLQIIKNISPNVSVTADLSESATGIYLIRCPVGGEWVSGKIVLRR